MPYNLFYGSPFAGGAAMGTALFNAAKDQETFSRDLQNNQMLLKKRDLDLQAANLVMQNKRAEAKQKLEEQRLLNERERITAQLESERLDRELRRETLGFNQSLALRTADREDRSLQLTEANTAADNARADEQLQINRDALTLKADAGELKYSPQEKEHLDNLDQTRDSLINLSKENSDRLIKLKTQFAAADKEYQDSLGGTRDDKHEKKTQLAKTARDNIQAEMDSIQSSSTRTNVDMIQAYKNAATSNKTLLNSDLITKFSQTDWNKAKFSVDVDGKATEKSPEATRLFAMRLLAAGRTDQLSELLSKIR